MRKHRQEYKVIPARYVSKRKQQIDPSSSLDDGQLTRES